MPTHFFHIDHTCKKRKTSIFWDGFFSFSFFPDFSKSRRKLNKHHACTLIKYGHLRDKEMYQVDLINIRKDFEAAQQQLIELHEPA